MSIFNKEKLTPHKIEQINKSFEDFLEEKHAEQYQGLDDDMLDAYNDWLENIDIQEVIEFTDDYIKTQEEQIRKEEREMVINYLEESKLETFSDDYKTGYKDCVSDVKRYIINN